MVTIKDLNTLKVTKNARLNLKYFKVIQHQMIKMGRQQTYTFNRINDDIEITLNRNIIDCTKVQDEGWLK